MFMEFGNDKSRIIRGIAIILMVTGHSCPGLVIPFAVPLFSFLIGYGYAFAHERTFRHGLKRTWHLLSHYWFVLLGVCMPLALLYGHFNFSGTGLLLNMIGLAPDYNWFCWFVAFYILVMAVMPWVSRLVDVWGLKGVVLVSLGGALLWWSTLWLAEDLNNATMWTVNRFFRYMPVIAVGYWLARFKIVGRLRFRAGVWTGLAALLLGLGLYMCRMFDAVKMLDAVLAPAVSLCVAFFFTGMAAGPWLLARTGGVLALVLTDLGVKSMHIWFLHALFIMHCTRGAFSFLDPLVVSDGMRWVVVLGASWVLASVTMPAFKGFKALGRAGRRLPLPGAR